MFRAELIGVMLGWWALGAAIAAFRYPYGAWKIFGWRGGIACAIWGAFGPLVVFIVAQRRVKRVRAH